MADTHIILRRVCVYIAILLSLGASRPARAQVPDAVYQDVRDVIDDLLTEEVAHSVVPQLACRAGRVQVQSKLANDPDVVQIHGTYYQLIALYHYPKSL